MYEGNPGEIDFGSSYCEVCVSEGSSCRESTVKVKFSRTLSDERLLIAAFCRLQNNRCLGLENRKSA